MPGGWRVTGQRGAEDLVNGRFVDVMEVSVVTDDGTTKSFRIPLGQYSRDNVKAIVDGWYEHVQAVNDINSV